MSGTAATSSSILAMLSWEPTRVPMLRFTADSGAASWVVLVLLVPPWALGAAWLVSHCSAPWSAPSR